jgi:carbamoyl-phosphate synthase large subunit
MGFLFYATKGTSDFMKAHGITSKILYWPLENKEPNTLSHIADGKIDLVINIPKNIKKEELDNDYLIRRKAIDYNVPLITNLQLAKRFVEAIEKTSLDELKVKSWAEYN